MGQAWYVIFKKIITGGKFTVYDAFNFYIINLFARNAGLHLNSPGTKDIFATALNGSKSKTFLNVLNSWNSHPPQINMQCA